MSRSGLNVRSLATSVALIALAFAGCKLAPPKEVYLPPVEHPLDEAHKQVKHGHEVYYEYCAACHGVTGQGNGPLAADLRVVPADLTRIGQRRGGVFPEPEIIEIIDGRRRVRGHGPGNMPLWGREFSNVYAGGTGDEYEMITRMRILELVGYLKSIQVAD